MYKIILALRYLLKRRITYFAVIAVALCVFTVSIVMTVMNGIVTDFRQRNYLFVGDCIVGTESLVGFAYYEDFIDILEKESAIEAVSPVIKSFAVLRRQGDDEDFVVEVMGIDAAGHSRVTGFADTLYISKNNMSNAFVPYYDPNLNGCIFGVSTPDSWEDEIIIKMAYSFSCFPLTYKGALAQAGTDMVNTKTFYLTNYSCSNLPREDATLVYLPFEQTQQLCGMAGATKRVSRLHIKFKSDVKLSSGCNIVQSLWQEYKQQNAGLLQAFLFDTVTVEDWKSFRRESIAPMENEQVELIVMFGFVGIITVFIILVVFYIIISHKSKDVGILKSIGASSTNIIELFCGFAFMIGFLGSVIGLFAGWQFLININRIENWLFEHYKFQLWDRTMFAIGDIPNQIDFKVLTIIALSAIFTCLLGAFIPTWQIARQKPVESLQVNQL